MTCVQSIQEDACLWAANLAHYNPVRSVAERRFQQVAESDLALVGVELGLGGDDVWLPYVKFGDVFEDEDAVAVGDETRDNIGQRRLTRARPT